MLHVGPRFGLVANRGLRWHRGAECGGMPSSVAGFGVVGFWVVMLVECWVYCGWLVVMWKFIVYFSCIWKYR